MGAVADAVLAAGGEVHGVITESLVAAEIAHGGLTALDVVDSMHSARPGWPNWPRLSWCCPAGSARSTRRSKC